MTSARVWTRQRNRGAHPPRAPTPGGWDEVGNDRGLRTPRPWPRTQRPAGRGSGNGLGPGRGGVAAGGISPEPAAADLAELLYGVVKGGRAQAQRRACGQGARGDSGERPQGGACVRGTRLKGAGTRAGASLALVGPQSRGQGHGSSPAQSARLMVNMGLCVRHMCVCSSWVTHTLTFRTNMSMCMSMCMPMGTSSLRGRALLNTCFMDR